MFAGIRAVFLIVLFSVVSLSALAADKPFQRADLSDAAIRLEDGIKRDAGQVSRPLATLRRDVDAAFQRNDVAGGLRLLGQLLAVDGNNGGAWLRLARSVLQVRPANDREKAVLRERAMTAAYIAYERAGNRNEEADALVLLGRLYAERNVWRPALDALRISLELREAADVRAQYEGYRDAHGFRLLDYSVDAEASSPRACFQFSENLLDKRVDYTPFVSMAGIDRAAVSASDRQLCVEGLKHGESYVVTLREGLPSAVKENLAKTVQFTLYVRDRKPFVHFSGRAYVLPRNGQQGIPVVSVNTTAVAVEVYRIGDRNLIDTVIGSDFQRNLYSYDIERLKDTNGAQVWKGELAVETLLNTEVTTAFPIDETVGELKPGIYVMTAAPAGGVTDDYGALATQWFIVSDLGLTSFSAPDGIHVFAHSLATATPKQALDVRLVSRSNEVLATKKTNGAGHVQFEAGLTRGEGGQSPAMIVASEQGDYAFLSLKAPAFDLKDRGVAGRPTPVGLDAYVYTERGVYRSGESVAITALLRDAQGTAVADTPVTLVVERPDGMEYKREAVPDQGIGGRSLSVAIAPNASSGTWRVRAYTDPKQPAIGETTFMVEDYVAERLDFTIATDSKTLSPATPTELHVDGHYLYGAAASGLTLEGELVLTPTRARPGFDGYLFGNSEDQPEAVRKTLEDLPQTDEAGKATVNIELDPSASEALMFDAQVTLRMAESGGRAVERKIALPVLPEAAMIGVKPLFSGRSLGQGENATFDVVMLDASGKPVARDGLHYELLKVESRYQWYRQDGAWQYEPIKSTKRISDGTLNVAADQPARLPLPMEWGRYRLEVSTGAADGPVTSIAFDAGWYAEASADTPDMLEIALDKPEYRIGETMNLSVSARTAGRLTVNVFGNGLLLTTSRDVEAGQTRVNLGVGRDWGNGAYVVATLRRPLDASQQRMPGRAIGVQWFSIEKKARTLTVDMTLPQTLRPDSALRIPVKLTGLTPGEPARIAIAAVDVGILNLTNYKPPSPDEYFLGQRRLSAEVRDLYGQLIDGMQGTRGQVRTGGDAGGAEISGSPPSQAPLSLFSGVVPVNADGTAEVSFDIPAFAGTVRVMAVAWSGDKSGHASADVIVRDPVVMTATLPRFLRTGDRGTLHVELDNVEGAAGDYRVSVASDGALGANAAPQTLTLREKQRTSLTVPLSSSVAGVANVKVTVSGPQGFALERNYALATLPATQTLARRSVQSIATGGSLTLSNDLFADFVPGTGTLSLSVGASTALDAASLLKALDRYPYGCSEQIASRAMPLLYVNEIANEAHLALDQDAEQRIKDSIVRLLARQASNGSFGLWGLGGDDVWLDSYITEFLTRAREHGFAVSDTAFRLSIDRLRNYVGNAGDPKDGGRDLAYALYVLARNGAAPIGDLRYLADTKLGDISTPIAKAQIAAALGMLGDKARADAVYAAALAAIVPQPLRDARADYGSALRDAAALVALAGEGNAPAATLASAVTRVDAARDQLTTTTSTQENAWMILAARAIAKQSSAIALDVNGEKRQGAVYSSFKAETLQAAPLTVANNGAAPVQAVLTVSGAPIVPEPAAEEGFKIERLYYTLDGESADPTQAKQNQRFAVVLRITEPQPQFGRIVVADHLPAGFEIDNPRLVSSGDTGTLSWITDAVAPETSEFRDDRFIAAFERKGGDRPVFTVAYVVRAVMPGSFVLPQASVEDMYRPERFGRTTTGKIEVSAAR